MINTDIKLPKPEQNYGAIYGRGNHQQEWRFVALILSVITLLAITAFLITLTSTVGMIAFLLNIVIIIISVFLIFWLALKTIGYNPDNYQKDIRQKRTNYAHTIFKQWVEQRYDIQITEDQALKLMNGSIIIVNKNDKERIVKFKRTPESSKLFTVGTKKYYDFKDTNENWDYDTDKIDFQLVIKKKAKPVKEKIWS